MKLNVKKIIFKLNVKFVVDSFRSLSVILSEFDVVLKYCKVLFSLYFKNSYADFSSRETNMVVHNLTRIAAYTSDHQY